MCNHRVRFVPMGRARRRVALLLLLSLLYTLFYPYTPLVAEPRFREFQEHGRPGVERYVNRASRLLDEQSWSSYVETGVAHELALWEADALEEIQKALRQNEEADLSEEKRQSVAERYYADFQAARLKWEEQASSYIEEERGAFRARLAVQDFRAELDDSADQNIEAFQRLVDEAEQVTASTVSLDLTLWDSVVDAGRDALQTAYYESVQARMGEIRANQSPMSMKERQAFEAELDRLEDDIRRTYETQENFYLLQGRNQYIAVHRVNDLSLRYEADADSAAAIASAVIDSAAEEAGAQSNELLDVLESGMTEGMNQGTSDAILVDQWESQIEALLESGLYRWQQAEEELYEKRLEWMNAARKSREETEAIWKKNHEILKSRREAWLKQVQEQIEAGRAAWESKLQAFYESRHSAEKELSRFIEEEKARRDGTLAQLGDMVRGGGAALAQAKESYRFFARMAEEAPDGPEGSPERSLKEFYIRQRDEMARTIVRFQSMLAGAENRLDGNMNSEDPSGGLLKDRRLYAGNLREELAGLDESDFEDELRSELADDSRWEKYLLYRRDLTELIEANALFAERTEELKQTAFDPEAGTTVADLRRRVELLEARFDDQRKELLRIIDRPRTGIDETAALTAIQQEIEDWFRISTDRNLRLKNQVLAYFDDAYAGYYLSENDNDPYLMTRAEYEWELLRRERDYVADRYERAALVKRYADLAEQYDAALEVASITRERADVAHARELLLETGYLLLKGDLEHGSGEEQFEELLLSRDIDVSGIRKASEALVQEQALLDEIAGLALSDLTADAVANLRKRITTHITDYDREERHRLAILGERLSALFSLAEDRREPALLQIRQTADMLAGEVQSLQQDYRLSDFLSERDEVFAIYTGESLAERIDDLSNVRAALEANAIELAQARKRLDAAKAEYGQAYTDYQILSGADSAAVVDIELKEAAAQLASLLNGMKDAAETKAPETALEERYREYYSLLAEHEQATKDLAYTEEILSVLSAAEAAEERRVMLNALLPELSSDLHSSNAVSRADALLSHPELVVRTGPAASYGIVIQAYDSLAHAKQQWLDLSGQLAEERAKDDPDPVQMEKLRAGLSRLSDTVDRSIEVIIDGIRGEAEVRQDLLLAFLNDSAAPDIADELSESEERLTEEAVGIAQEALSDLVTFLETNRQRDFAGLLAAANALVEVRRRHIDTGTSSDYRQYIDPSSIDGRGYEVAVLIREWLLSNEDSINSANADPTSANPLTNEERWDELIAHVQAEKDLADRGAALRSDLPVSADDPRIVAYRNARESLLTRMQAVLSANDDSLRMTYLSLSAEDREVLGRYGVVSMTSAEELRRSLKQAEQALRVELASLESTYRSVYLQELAVSTGRQASLDESALVNVWRDLEATVLTLGRLRRERDAILENGQTPSAGLLNEISRLEDLHEDLRQQQLAKEASLRQSQALLAELQSPGSSVALLESALSLLSVEYSRQLVVAQLLSGMQQKAVLESDEVDSSAVDELKAMMGFYQTDADGHILRNEDGEGIVSDEFAELGFDSSSSIDDILAGGWNATQLEGWARRILSYLRDPYRSERTPQSIRVAAARLESSLIELAAARSFIEKAWQWDASNQAWVVDSETIRLDARADEERYAKLQTKLAHFADFEASLKQAILEAGSDQGNAVAAALAVLEKPENAYIFRLFDGYDRDGAFDGIYDETMKGRVLQLSQTVDRLRRQQRDAALYGMAESYGLYLSDALTGYGASAGLVAADPGDYIKEMQALDPGITREKVRALDDTGFEKNIRAALDGLPSSAYLYRSHLLSIIEKSPLQGAELKAELLSAIDGLEADMVHSLEALLGESFTGFRMQADLTFTPGVEESVSAFIERYMQRTQTTRSVLATFADDTDLWEGNLDERKNALREHLQDELSHAVFTGIRRDLFAIIEEAEDFNALREAIQTYAEELHDPTEAEVLTARETVLVRLLRAMLALGDSLDTFDAGLIPEEFREFVLLRQYERAENRYQEFLSLKTSDLQSERESAVLDLRGIAGDFASSILLRDFTQWQAEHSIEDFLNQARTARSVQDYLNEYMRDRNTSSDLLPEGGNALINLVMQQEYSRLVAAGMQDGIDALDERDYLSDFTDRIYMERVKSFADRSGFILTGNLEEDELNFRSVFDAMLGEARYGHGGLSFRERLVGDNTLESYFDAGFAFLVQGPSIEMYDPLAIRLMRSSGALNEPIHSESVLPDEWIQYRTEHPDYADLKSVNYRTVLKEISEDLEAPVLYQELARIEALEHASRLAGSGHMVLSVSGEDLERLIDLAGYADVADRDSLQDEVRRFLLEQALQQSEGSLQDFLRQDALLQYHYPTESEKDALQIFLASEGEHVVSIETIFFDKLKQSDGRLRELAKNDRGGFFYHLIYAGDADFSVPAELVSSFTDLKTGFFASLTDRERRSLLDHADSYRKYFAMRSSQELIATGIFEGIEAEIYGALAGSGITDAELAEARRYRSSLLVAFVRSLSEKNADQEVVLAHLPASMPDNIRDDVSAAIVSAIADLNPVFAQMLRKETILLERFLARYLESDSLRNDLVDLLKGEEDIMDFSSGHTWQRAIAEQGIAETQYGLLSRIQADRRVLDVLASDYRLKQAVAGRLASFATQRGDHVSQNRFVNYRTYVDDGSGALEAEYRAYLADALNDDRYLDPDFYDLSSAPPVTAVKTYYEFREGMLLRAQDALDPAGEAIVASELPGMFADGSFVQRLISDRNRNDSESITVGQATDEAEDRVVQLRSVQRIRYDAGVTGEEQITQAYYAHLANHYLESLSDLNESLRHLAVAASAVDAGTDIKDRLQHQLESAELENLDLLRTTLDTERTAALTLQSNTASSAQNEMRAGIDGLEESLAQAEEQFGAAARRKHLKAMGQTLYIAQVFAPVAEEFEAARQDYDSLAAQAGDLQDDYSKALGRYTEHLDGMGAWWRRFDSAQSEAQRLLSVKDYADTPYLFSTIMNSTEEDRLKTLKQYATDAREEYHRAGLLLEQTDERLKAAGYRVQIEANLDRFDRVLAILDHPDPAIAVSVTIPLTEDERAELVELRDLVYRQYRFLSVEEARQARNEEIDADDIDRLEQLENRELYQQYGTLIQTRAEYIKHTMRMIRLQKAQALVQAEIQSLEIEVAEKQQRFEEALAHHFGDPSNIADAGEREEAIEARNAVYQRLAAQYEGGGMDFYDEMSSWYWLSGDWLGQFGKQSMTEHLTITPAQMGLAAASMHYGQKNTSSSDRSAIGRWLSEKAGSVFSAFAAFSSLYFRMLIGFGNYDRAHLKYGITVATWAPVVFSSQARIGEIYGKLTLMPWLAAGLPGLILALIEGKRQIAVAGAELSMAQAMAIITAFNVRDYASRHPGTAVKEVLDKQREYESAKARLEYFTKVPDMKTLKGRLLRYGEMHDDPDSDLSTALYSLTEDDLCYLVEVSEDGNITAIDSTGEAQELSDAEAPELYDATPVQKDAEYTDIFGRTYDRDQIITYLDPGYDSFYREGDSYHSSSLSGRFTRIRTVDHDGTVRYAYALLDNVENQTVYHAGEILRNLVDHGTTLRTERLQQYLAAGQAQTRGNDWSFILAERDRTMKALFAEAASREDAEGGREFAGYMMVFSEYEANQQAVFDLELQQRAELQQKEWDLREQDMLYRHEEWQSRIEAIVSSGKRAWGDAEDRYLSEWRQWERDLEQTIEEGNREWDEQIASHMAEREQWKKDLKNKASEAATEAAITDVLGSYNAQLQNLSENNGIGIPPVSLTGAIEGAKEEILANLPSRTDRVAAINESIERFNKSLSLSQMYGMDTHSPVSGLSADFRSEMASFQKQMIIYSNAKELEQYQKLMSDLLELIDRQNRAIEQQTERAAIEAGFVRLGNAYVKQGRLVPGAVGLVEAYQWYDGKAAFEKYTASASDDTVMQDLPAFLETADTVQVGSFFAVQKLILQRAFDRIMGTGTAAERKNSRDKDVIGDLAWWIGRPAGTNPFVSQLEKGAPYLGGEEQEKLGMDGAVTAVDAVKYLADPGFGELGSSGNRPSGIYLGFYNKLDLVSRYVDHKDAEQRERREGSIDPVSATLNQFNGMTMIANAVHNVRVASQVFDKDVGYMVEAQLLGLMRGALPAVGLVLGGPAGASAGASAASLLHVDGKTGKRSFQLKEQTIIASSIAAGLGAMEPGLTQDLISAATSGMEYDANGKFTGRFSGSSAAIAFAGDKAASRFSSSHLKQYMARDITTQILTLGREHYRYSHGHQNVYGELASPDMLRFGSLVGGAGMSIRKDALRKELLELIKGDGTDGQTDSDPRERTLKGEIEKVLEEVNKQANEEDKKRRIIETLQAFAVYGLARVLSRLNDLEQEIQETSEETGKLLTDLPSYAYKFSFDLFRFALGVTFFLPVQTIVLGIGTTSAVGHTLGFAYRGARSAYYGLAGGAWAGANTVYRVMAGILSLAVLPYSFALLGVAALALGGALLPVAAAHAAYGANGNDENVYESLSQWLQETGGALWSTFGEWGISSFAGIRESNDDILEWALPGIKEPWTREKEAAVMQRLFETVKLWDLKDWIKNEKPDADGLYRLREDGFLFEIDSNGRLKNLLMERGHSILGLNRAYLNGEPMNDGDIVFRGLDQKLSLVTGGQKEVIRQLAALRKKYPEKRYIFTQNGVLNRPVDALALNDMVRLRLASAVQNYGGSMAVYNSSSVLGDFFSLGLSYALQLLVMPGTEPASGTWNAVLESEILKDGGLIVAHSQGAQIVTHALHVWNKADRNRTINTIDADLLLLGGAHTIKAVGIVKTVYDARNKPDYAAGVFHWAGDGINGSLPNSNRYQLLMAPTMGLPLNHTAVDTYPWALDAYVKAKERIR